MKILRLLLRLPKGGEGPHARLVFPATPDMKNIGADSAHNRHIQIKCNHNTINTGNKLQHLRFVYYCTAFLYNFGTQPSEPRGLFGPRSRSCQTRGGQRKHRRQRQDGQRLAVLSRSRSPAGLAIQGVCRSPLWLTPPSPLIPFPDCPTAPSIPLSNPLWLSPAAPRVAKILT